jgi:hypothetical protein
MLAAQTFDILKENQVLAMRAVKRLHPVNSQQLARTLARARRLRV